MNCRSEVLEVSVEGRQVDEAMLALLHTILLHRSTGKFHYKKEGTYSIGTVGTQDVDCDFIDFSFVRVSSDELDRVIRKAVAEFKVKIKKSSRLDMSMSYTMIVLFYFNVQESKIIQTITEIVMILLGIALVLMETIVQPL